MTPQRSSVSPLPSYASRPFASRPVSMVEMLRQIIAWLRGDQPSLREQFAEQQLIEKLAVELGEQEAKADKGKC